MVIKLEEIVPKKAQILCLFALLEERVHRISHRSMPSFEEHEKFVTWSMNIQMDKKDHLIRSLTMN